jgi:hypothetical protein
LPGPADVPISPLDRFAVPSQIVEIKPPTARQFAAKTVLNDVAPPAVAGESRKAAGLSRREPRLALRETSPRLLLAEPSWPRAANEATTDVVKRWPMPEALVERLERLTGYEACQDWNDQVLQQLRRLRSLETLADDEVAAVLDSLQELSRRGIDEAGRCAESSLHSDWSRAAYALKRRCEIWGQIRAIASAETVPVSLTAADVSHVRPVIEVLEAKLERVKHGSLWRDYLAIDEAKQRFCTAAAADTVECRNTAKRILLSIEYSLLKPSQHAFLSQPELADYVAQLRHLAAEPVDYFRLMHEIERFERGGTDGHALHVAAAQQVLRWSDDPAVSELGKRLDANFRNANIRFAVSRRLIDRLIPQPKRINRDVEHEILGATTQGCSETTARMCVRLLPNRHSWRLGLVARGRVISETWSSRGSTCFYSEGDSSFLAEKQIEVHRHGYLHRNAVAGASSSARLTGLETDLDALPLIGDIAQAVALQQYESRVPEARSRAEHRLASEVRGRLDEEVTRQFKRIRQQFTDHVFTPMQKLALNPVALEMQTTQERLIARYRLAGYHQLAAHTPRPIAPSDSVVSVQIHESALNNLVEQLGWEGREVNPRDLYRELGALFGYPDVQIPEDVPEDVTMRFASQDPLRFTFQDGHVNIQLSLAELSQGRRRWQDFTVRVHYRPANEQPEADLVRDRYVELIGQRLGFRDQIALRGIFSRVFALNRPIDVVSRRLNGNPRLAGLHITQLAIGDGWLALAVGKKGTGAFNGPS